MADITEIRVALAGSLEPIEQLQESPFLLSNPTPPCAEIVPAPIEYDKAFARGTDLIKLIVRVMVGINTDVGAQKLLDTFLASSGPKSIKAALETDESLGGLVDNVNVTACTGYRIFKREGGASLLGAEWTVEVLAPGV